MPRQTTNSARTLKNTVIGQFTLLNDEKLGRVLDLIEGIKDPANPEEARIVKECEALGRENGILALYDRLGGAIRLDDRKLTMGTFFDFKARKPHNKPQIDEADFADEYVLVPKRQNKAAKNETTSDRVARLRQEATNIEARSTGNTAKKPEDDKRQNKAAKKALLKTK